MGRPSSLSKSQEEKSIGLSSSVCAQLEHINLYIDITGIHVLLL